MYGTLNLNSGTFKLGSSSTATTFPAFGTLSIAAGTTIEYTSGQAQSVSATPSYQNLTISGAGTKTLGGALTVNGDLSISSGTTLDADSTHNYGISLAGNWVNNGGTFTPRSGTVTFNSTSASQAIKGTAASQTFYNITVNKTGQTFSIGDSTTTLTLNATLTLSAGTFSAGTATTINVAGGWSNSGTSFAAGSRTVKLSGSPHILGTTTTTFNNLEIVTGTTYADVKL